MKITFYTNNKVEILVIKNDDGDGNILLSKKKLQSGENWEEINAALDSKEVVNATVVKEVKGGAAISGRVTPRSSKNEIVEIMDDGTIKVKITAPPVDGKANQALLEFLGKALGIKANQLEVVAGQTGRDKLITITGLGPEEVQQKIVAYMS